MKFWTFRLKLNDLHRIIFVIQLHSLILVYRVNTVHMSNLYFSFGHISCERYCWSYGPHGDILTTCMLPGIIRLDRIQPVHRAIITVTEEPQAKGKKVTKRKQASKSSYLKSHSAHTGLTWWQVCGSLIYYIMAGHAIVVVKDIILLFHHGNAVILTLW